MAVATVSRVAPGRRLAAITPLRPERAAALVHDVLDRVDLAAGPEQAGAATIVAVDRAISRLQALRLSLVAAADRSEVAARLGMTGTGAWLAAQTRTDGVAAAADVRLAGALEGGLPATREALAAGELSAQHAAVIADATSKLPAGLSADQAATIETALVTRAKMVDPRALRTSARRALAAVERSEAAVDAHEDRVLRSDEERAWDRAHLSLRDHADGTTTGHFTVPTVAAAILRKAIQQMASPRRFADRAARHGARTAAEQRAAAARADWPRRYGQAFTELLEHLPTDRLHGKVSATVVVTVQHDRLKAGLGAAHLDTGHDLSASAARRLACNAGILPAVLGRRSVPLDLGRSDRFFTQGQRVALATVYRSCAAFACDRPYAWSELHHRQPWSRQGTTDLRNAVPLCGHHHRRIHDPQYGHRLRENDDGTKTVTFWRRP